MAENIYFEVTNACMHACATCPHGSHNKRSSVYFTPVDDLIRIVSDAMEKKNVRSVTISGGEPLLHPDIVEIVSKLTNMGLHITMLSNLQILVSNGLAERLAQAAPHMTMVTALHSIDPEVHDSITNHPGSFSAALAGIDELSRLHMDVVIKVILSLRTCRELPAIGQMLLKHWGKSVRLNLCGLDLCGVRNDEIMKYPVNLPQEGPLIEQFLDDISPIYGEQVQRFISITEYPLCWIDPYFWKLFHLGSSRVMAYVQEDRMNTSDTLRTESTCGCHPQKCQSCVASSICPGVWWSVYCAYGEECVRPYLPNAHASADQ